MELPAAQAAIRAKCGLASPTFIPFSADAVEQSLTQRFEAQARRFPRQLAIRTRTHALTYSELDARANRIAHAILDRRGEGEEAIALLFGHDAMAIVAMLGVLKAGKCYVPIDPSYPGQRIEQMLGDSGAVVLLTDGRHLSRARELASDSVRVIDVDGLHGPEINPDVRSGPRSRAFVLYTSGSTGRPKGITQSHRNVLHEAMHYTNSGHFGADDRFLLVSSVSFGDSVRTIYAALLNGASLYPFDVRAEGLVPLAGWLREHSITIYRSIPTTFRHFVASLKGDEDFRSLRLVYLGGETVHKTDVELYKRHFPPQCVLVNRLGTTETLTFRSCFIDHATAINGSGVPVGYAVPDKDVLVVDENGAPVKPGAIGEVLVRSRYLSPTLPADPVDPDFRVYRTGDLGRLHADGCLEHLGRTDFQVKIRGHRVETADVEAALLSTGTLREAVVVARRRHGDDALVAYVVPATGQAPEVGALRRRLAAQLPGYMIPSACVVLDAMPLLPNGKVNRRALPDPGTTRPELDLPFVAPRNDAEAAIAQIWADLLTLDRVGVHDDFLDLGGDSLMATRIIARVSDRFRVTVPLRLLWGASTVARMAEIVSR
jgi:amino acid adenylation domain-containing protein